MSLSCQTPLNVLGTLTALSAIDLLGQLGNLNLGEAGSNVYKPRVDVLQKENGLCVYAEMTGVKKGDLHVEVKGDMLILRGRKEMPEEYKDSEIMCSSRSFGKFSTMVPLPKGVHFEDIKTHFNHGILKICIPVKSEHTKRHEIHVE